jgi:hypothetical protein
MALYAEGEQEAALVFFRKALRESPGDPSALAAVRRVEAEIRTRRAAAPPQAVSAALPASAGRVEELFLVVVPRWFYFERTVGNGLSDIGTLNALNARIVQLLGERKLALAQSRVFRNERRLRELLRRAPLAALATDEV